MTDPIHLDWPSAPLWSDIAGTAGRVLILGGGVLFLLSIVLWALSSRRTGLGRLGAIAFGAGCLSLFAALGCLAALFIGDQFQYDYVFARADSINALQYKIAGVWAGQEGSFLLWGCASALFGLFAARASGVYRRWFTITFALFLGVLCGILAYESPFDMTLMDGKALVPPRGAGLTPSLQNYWVVIHPPVIFLGFGSLTVLFAWSVAAMMTRRPLEWAAQVRPWAVLGLTLLGIGLCMGGFWAYETLGWGGFWAWDPVENVSFVPWCVAAAFVHGLIVQNTRKRWIPTNLLLAGMPFLLFVYGTFLTRSGYLTDVSVHSFAEMDLSARQLLLYFLLAASVLFLGLWLWRGRTAGREFRGHEEPSLQGAHREGAYRLSSMLLVAMAAATAIGMSVPLFMALSGRSVKVVEEGLYHQVLVWFFIPIMLLMAVGPFLSWRGMSLRDLSLRLVNILSLAVAIVGVSVFFLKRSSWIAYADPDERIPLMGKFMVPVMPWVMLLFGVCVFAIVANLWRLAELWKRSKLGVGGLLSHVGVATLLAGLVVSRGFEVKSEMLTLPRGGSAQGMGFTVKYLGRAIETDDSMEYLYDRDNKIRFEVSSESERFIASPGMFYVAKPDQEQPDQMVWPHIHRTLWHDVYFTLRGEATEVGPAQTLRPGETAKLGDLQVKYLKMVREGESGMSGTRFVAELEVTDPETGATTIARPALELGDGGARPIEGKIGADYLVFLHRMDAATRSVDVQLFYSRPWYPVEIFYKPMTILVWVGTGIMAVGGFLTAWYRRRPSAPVADEPPSKTLERTADAPEPVAQS
ncbi:MAG TPA: cytochrome c biogenesis protein CcsA [Fimbriimonadaceae bacterium]|nr:cytochrome c biogenesis protein CcsA [Fimbriimonadaceae bacterium]